MARKGYISENKCKKELIRKYGKFSVVKIAIGGAEDFLVVGRGELIKVVEVKEVHHKNYSPRPREKEQIKRIIEFAKHHLIPAELWIYKYFGPGKPFIKEIKLLHKGG